jgi:hypothetical protein
MILNLWKWTFTITKKPTTDFGSVLMTINIMDKGTLCTKVGPMKPQAELLGYAMSQMYIDEWGRVSNMTNTDVGRWKDRIDALTKAGNKLPVIAALREMESSVSLPVNPDNRDVQ